MAVDELLLDGRPANAEAKTGAQEPDPREALAEIELFLDDLKLQEMRDNRRRVEVYRDELARLDDFLESVRLTAPTDPAGAQPYRHASAGGRVRCAVRPTRLPGSSEGPSGVRHSSRRPRSSRMGEGRLAPIN